MYGPKTPLPIPFDRSGTVYGSSGSVSAYDCASIVAPEHANKRKVTVVCGSDRSIASAAWAAPAFAER